MNHAIKVSGLSKHYRIGTRQTGYGTLREALGGTLRAPLRRLRRNGGAADSLWALRDVSFTVESGEVVGVVGRNGAGKSTLLKIISRITDPTEGRVDIYGRVGSLLEVGTGFHPELSGRENIFLSGAILGMGRAEIRRKFDEIVAFSEIERFIDTPVKRYSSGMYVRLAFSVAAHLEPDILIVDEVLSVGDMAFQRKCLDKIASMRQHARAILLVTHSMISVRAICTRALLLSDGRLIEAGEPDRIVPLYEKLMMESVRADGESDEEEDGLGLVKIKSIKLVHGRGEDGRSFDVGERVRVVIEFATTQRVDEPVIYIGIRRPDGFICTATSTKLEGVHLPFLDGEGRVELEIPALSVTPGHYVLDVTFYDQNFEFRTYFLGRRRVGFQVSTDLPSLDEKYGVVYQKLSWNVEGINGGHSAPVAGARHLASSSPPLSVPRRPS